MEISAIVTSRLTLEPLTVSHAVEMVAVLADRALYEYTGGSPPTLPDLESRYRSLGDGPSDPTHGWLNWIVRDTTTGRSLGFVQATTHGQNADLAWLIGIRHQGRGFATEATAGMAAWLRARGIRRLSANIHPRHVASRRVAAATGLVETAQRADGGETVWRSTVRLRRD